MTRGAGPVAILALVAVLAVACSADVDTEATAPAGTAGRGWVGGEPAWDGDVAGGEGSGMDAAVPMVAEGAPTAVGRDVRPIDGAGPMGPRSGPLNAGSVDDNAAFADFLAYLERVQPIGIRGRAYDPSGRIVIRVVDADGRPLDGIPVQATASGADDDVTQLLTDPAGSVRLHPAADGPTGFTIAVGDQTVSAARGDDVTVTLGDAAGAAIGVPVDVMFVLDATGSMDDEIEQLRSTMIDVAQRLAGLPAQPDLRYGMTVYRDEGDAFVTSVYDFTGDVTAFTGALAAVVAAGGGDTPEALDEALAAALGEPAWRDPATTVQLMFLVADAPPHIDRQVPTPYTQSIADAAGRGITVHAIAASSTDDQAELVFRQVAQGTGGRFVFLAYGDGVTATGPSTDIDRLDYEELPLGDLVVRLVGEALATLTGTAPESPTPTTVAPTNPPGQD